MGVGRWELLGGARWELVGGRWELSGRMHADSCEVGGTFGYGWCEVGCMLSTC